MSEILKRLDRRYKCCRVLRRVLLIASCIVAIAPAIFVAVRVAPSFPRVKLVDGIATFAIFILAVGLIFIIRGLEKRYAHKLPWATSALFWSWVLYFMIHSLSRVISQSVQISLALAIGVSVAFVLSLGAELCLAIEKTAEEEYRRYASGK